jgi:hypothetical protein
MNDLRSDLAQKSNFKNNVIEKYLKPDHYGSNFGTPAEEESKSDLTKDLKKEEIRRHDKKVADKITFQFD